MKKRYVKVYDEEWVEKEFIDLKKGNKFKLFEADGEPVKNGKVFTAVSDAFWNTEYNNIAVEIENFEE
jgi:hypothetical protein